MFEPHFRTKFGPHSIGNPAGPIFSVYTCPLNCNGILGQFWVQYCGWFWAMSRIEFPSCNTRQSSEWSACVLAAIKSEQRENSISQARFATLGLHDGRRRWRRYGRTRRRKSIYLVHFARGGGGARNTRGASPPPPPLCVRSLASNRVPIVR